jgi:glucokinase
MIIGSEGGRQVRLPVAALEIGGTHVTASRIDQDTGELVGHRQRQPLDGHADARAILNSINAAAVAIDAGPNARWGVAMPGPFDYPSGIALFRDVGKFDALYGVDVRAELTSALRPAAIAFVNDADAFTLGEYLGGTAARTARYTGLTLGTGMGTGWVVAGGIRDRGPGVPPGGRINNLTVHGAAVEQSASRRAIRRAYASATGDAAADVREVADRARAGERAARSVLAYAFRSLGTALGPCLRAFGTDVLVVGGSMSASWDLVEPWFLEGAGGCDAVVTVSTDGERAALAGAARCAMRT